MILASSEISESVQLGLIEIEPYTPAHLNGASYDLTLGNQVRVYDSTVTIKPGSVKDGTNISKKLTGLLDPRKLNATTLLTMPDSGFVLQPGIGYLLHTRERVKTIRHVPVLDGKSSIGRLFLTVHVTAGYGDPGFDGQYTLEAIAKHRVIVYPGMRICQIRFHTMEGTAKPYSQNGHYVGEKAQGPVPSQPLLETK